MTATIPVYIDDIIGDVVDMVEASVLATIQVNETAALGGTKIQQIRYSKSSYNELLETLAQADGSSEERFNKYPLIHLVQDVTVERGSDVGIFGTTSLNIVFIHQTEQTYKVEDRDAKVFKPVLWPIYYDFMAQLYNSKWFVMNDTGEYRHQVTKRAYWGNRKLKSSELILNDFVDAIEVRNLNLKFFFKNC
ncbi:MAG: hypothetical protein V4560_14770 [Bacteroidota bacterium]